MPPARRWATWRLTWPVGDDGAAVVGVEPPRAQLDSRKRKNRVAMATGGALEVAYNDELREPDGPRAASIEDDREGANIVRLEQVTARWTTGTPSSGQ